MATLTAKTGELILIDDADHAWLSKYRWSLNSSGYPQASGGKLLHRMITGAQKGEYVDHVHQNPLDCRRSELRLCRQSQNLANRRKQANRSSQYKGVSWHKQHQKWQVRITSRQTGRLLHIGYFTDEVQAAKAYDDAARAQYGEFALTNFEVGHESDYHTAEGQRWSTSPDGALQHDQAAELSALGASVGGGDVR